MKKSLLLFLLATTLLFSQSKESRIEKIGDYVQLAIPATAWITTLAIGDTQGQYDFYKSFFSTFATTHALKLTVKEERPDGSNDKSFPSGHTSASFQGATFIHLRYGMKYAAVAYVGATFVAWSRVYTDHHYTHDVVAGALIGSGFSWYFTEPYKVKNVEVMPVVFNSIDNKQNIYGLKITW